MRLMAFCECGKAHDPNESGEFERCLACQLEHLRAIRPDKVE